MAEKIYLSVPGIMYPTCGESYDWGPGIRDIYIIHYVRRGRGFFECGGKKYALSAGQSFLICPGQMVHYYPDKADPWEYAWINFAGLEAKKLLSYCALSADNPVTARAHPLLDGMFLSAAKQYEVLTPAHICRNVANFRLIFAEYLRHYPASADKTADEIIISRGVEYVENNYRHRALSIDEVADFCGVNRVTLHRKFIRELGVSPGNYIINLRLQKACGLLEKSDFSVKAIAYSVGFSDQLYFSKVFKKHLGVTPTGYRKNSCQNQIIMV